MLAVCLQCVPFKYKLSSFKGSENIRKKEGGSDRSVANNEFSYVTLNELAMEARDIILQQGSQSDMNPKGMPNNKHLV